MRKRACGARTAMAIFARIQKPQPRAGSVAWHRPLRLIAASAVVSACFLFAYFGLEKINRIGSDDTGFDR